MTKFVYADNAATTKLDIDAFEAMKPFLLQEYGNASQPYSFSRSSKKAIKEARTIIAKCINAEPDEIYFTSGGTESNNWVLNSIAGCNRDCKIITDNIEHHAILETCHSLEAQGYNIQYISANKIGKIDIEIFEASISDNVKLASIMLANNEIGTIQDIQKLCEIAHKNGILFHTDAVQAIGHIPVDVKKLGIDFLSASAHKFNGPKGIGFLYIKKGIEIRPFMNGGAQENGLRAGTENVASIMAMAIALKKNVENIIPNMQHIKNLEYELIRRLALSEIDFIRNGDMEHHIPGNINLSFKGQDGEVLLHRLDLKGIMVSTGAACDTQNTQISHVLKAIGIPNDYAEGTIRISLSKDNTMADIVYIIDELIKILN